MTRTTRPILVFLAVLTASFTPGPVPTAHADDGGFQGPVELVSRSGQPIDRGNRTTEFLVRLPADATCPGDTMHDGWVIDSWILPSTEDPAKSEVGRYGPEPRYDAQKVGRRASWYSADLRPYQWESLQPNPQASQPAKLGDIPVLSMAYYVKYMRLGEGTYHLGIGCDLNGEPTKYWQTDVIVTRPDGVDGQTLEWRLATAPAKAPDSDGSSWPVTYIVGAVLLAAAVVGAGYALRRSAHGRSTIHQLRSSK